MNRNLIIIREFYHTNCTKIEIQVIFNSILKCNINKETKSENNNPLEEKSSNFRVFFF